MTRPSKLKAGLLIAVFGLPIAVTSLAGGTWAAFGLTEVLVYSGPPDEWTSLQALLSWLIPALGIVGGAVLGVVLTAFVAIDAFPFGRYRLRLVPNDDTTPEVFS